ncbi:hypothetical protein O6H91_12G049900 [Diphasiastrum complanatum]|uniref:Uncharacterized protein n=1 Tax=Diphasiastrum complanatum TaxID=34168 RepID=A0ACC2C2M5_DIPCM|nr:hypothetical protein O6H91_12G049900 [Diphasiastrum complanatum]
MAKVMGILKQGKQAASRCLMQYHKQSMCDGLVQRSTVDTSTIIRGLDKKHAVASKGNLNLMSGVRHFKMRGPRGWIQGPEGGQTSQRLLIVSILVGGTLAIVYVTHIQTVPYTNRKHFVLISPATERKLGEMSYRELLKEFKGKILPQYHPEVIRVSRIAQRIIESAMMGIRAEDWGQLEHGGKHISDATLWGENEDKTSRKKDTAIEDISHKDLYAEDDTFDETWVERSRQEGLKQGRKGYTEHLEGMKWEVLVVDAPTVNAVCMPGGKIMVFTGLLKHFRTDEEIATVLAHEVGHALARHSAETLTRSIFLGFFEVLVLLVVNAPSVVSTVSNILLRLPFSRRMETEADHIGLLLMASAGYDPRIAPSVYERLGQLEKVPEYAQYISTHPSGKKRAELLRKSGTMNEALNMYREKVVGRQAQGYLFL